MTTDSSFEVSYRVRFQDVDHAGIIFFARILGYCHEALEDLQRQAGVPLEEFFFGRNLGAPLVDVQARFHQPYRHGDVLHIQVEIASMGRSSMKTRYRCLSEDGALSAEIEIVQVFIAADTMEPTSIPDDIRTALQPWVIADSEEHM